MTDDRPIKAHLDEEMREHIEFTLRTIGRNLDVFRGESVEIDRRIRINERCLKEIMEAGT